MSSPDKSHADPHLTQGVVVVELDDDAILARHAKLTARDNVMGLEASVASLQLQLLVLRKRARRLRDSLEDRTEELDRMRSSRAWRVGRAMTAPGRRLRR